MLIIACWLFKNGVLWHRKIESKISNKQLTIINEIT